MGEDQACAQAEMVPGKGRLQGAGLAAAAGVVSACEDLSGRKGVLPTYSLKLPIIYSLQLAACRWRLSAIDVKYGGS